MARYRRFDAVRLETAAAESETLESVRLRRAGLRAAMGGLERALAAPAPGRLDEWTAAVLEAVRELRDVWTRHVVETETPNGFLDELTESAPRLSNQVRQLRAEHTEVFDGLTRAEGDLQLRTVDDEDEWTGAVRAHLTELLGTLAHHRQLGSDLIYEAYTVDVGGDE
jgi:hypothetical protein